MILSDSITHWLMISDCNSAICMDIIYQVRDYYVNIVEIVMINTNVLDAINIVNYKAG